MISTCAQNVQLVNVPPDAVEFPMKVVNSGRVLVVYSVVRNQEMMAVFPSFVGRHPPQPSPC